MKLSSLLLAVALLLSTSAHAESGPTYAVETFDLFGVELGMSYAEALEAFTKALDLEPSQLEFGDPINNPETGNSEPGYFAFQGGSYRVLVGLITTISIDGEKHSRVVGAIRYRADRHAPLHQLLDFTNPGYSPPSSWPLIVDFVNKYGKPSYSSPKYDHRRYSPDRFGWCGEFKPGYSTICNKQKPHLTVNYYNPEVRLADESYYTALRDYNTRVDIKRGLANIEEALREYYKYMKRLPTQEQGISALTTKSVRYLCRGDTVAWLDSGDHIYMYEAYSVDHYGNDYLYRINDDGVATVISIGKNGQDDNCEGDDICIDVIPSLAEQNIFCAEWPDS